MTDTREPNGEGRARGRSISGWRVGLILGLLVIVGFVGCREFVFKVLAEPPDESLRLENRTDETVHIYYVLVDGSEQPSPIVPTIGPRSSAEIFIPCGAGGYVARDIEGGLVSRRGPFEDCNLEDWIIEPPEG